MTKKTLIYSTYYAFLFGLLGWKIISTLLTGSVVIGYRAELRALASEKEALEETLQAEQSALQLAQALTTLDPQTLSSFEPINQPVSINVNHSLALRY